MSYIVDFRQMKKAFAVGAVSLLACYVVGYIKEVQPEFRSARIISHKNDTATRNTTDAIRISPHDVVTATAMPWAARCIHHGKRYARIFWNAHLNDTTPTATATDQIIHSPPHWCTQDTYDRVSCKNDTQVLCEPKGLLFVKTPKTGSTTLARVVKRIAQNVAKRSNVDVCQHRENHVDGAGLWYRNRNPQHSFLMASIRDPAKRAMSRFDWSYVTRHSHNSSAPIQLEDDFIQDYIMRKSTNVPTGCTSKRQGGYQLNYITMSFIPEWSAWNPDNPTQVKNSEHVEGHVQQAMMDYDFMLLNERMDDSLVILQLLLGLQAGDIVSLSYNVGGSYRYEHGNCKQLIKSVVSPGMQEFFQSDLWYASNYGDYLLYAAVNASLDLTIDRIGRERFDTAMQEFKRMEAKVNQICSQRVPFPCSATGTVLFHTDHPIPHDKIAQCIDNIVQQEVNEAVSS